MCGRSIYSKLMNTLLITVLLSFRCMRKAIAMNETFCADLSSRAPSIEELEKIFPLFGNTENSLQYITSPKAKQHFKEMLNEGCLADFCDTAYHCREELRHKFRNLAISYFGIINMQNLSLVPESQFVSYVNRMATPPSYGVRTMFDLACLIMCPILVDGGLTNLAKCACPNPCKQQRNCALEKCIQLGFLEHQYTCDCDNELEWDAELHTCVPSAIFFSRLTKSKEILANDPTKRKSTPKCSENGTLFRDTDVTGTIHTCVCKPHYTGKFCTELVDACRDRVRHAYLPGGGLTVAGDTACNVNSDKNVCRSFLSSEGIISYRCNCDEDKWIPDNSLAYDNCLKRRTSCDSLVCLHGKCVTNERGTQSYCLCHPGYSGESCTEWVGVWTEWSAWDRCSPACGDVRYSVRSRDCLSMRPDAKEMIECLGASIEYAKCDEHPCARSEGTFVNTYFAVRQNGIAASIVAAAVACAIVCGIWSLFCWSIVSRLVIGSYRKFQGRIERKTEARVKQSQSLDILTTKTS